MLMLRDRGHAAIKQSSYAIEPRQPVEQRLFEVRLIKSAELRMTVRASRRTDLH
jgi:hypothetical protein